MTDVKTPAQIRCVACGGTSLTPPTQAYSFKTEGAFVLHYDVEGGSLMGVMFRGGDPGSASIRAKLGSACLDCGHMMTFADPEELAEVRKLASKLRPPK